VGAEVIELPTAENPVVILHGDCLEILPMLPKGCVSAVVTDPPYGISVTKMTLGNRKASKPIYRSGNWDDDTPDLKLMVELGLPMIVWGGNHFDLPLRRGWLVWDKATGANSFSDAELAWTSFGAAIRMTRIPWVGANAKETCDYDRYHPTQKPIALMRWCIGHLPEDAGIILDPFAGSGTTGVAAVLEGRRCILIEKDERYVEIARRRVAEALGKPTVLASGKTVGRNLFAEVK